jgi:hydroxyacylglutathione hydrolase
MTLKRLAVALGLALLLFGSAALLFAPYVMPELHFFSARYDIVSASTPELAKGHMVDDYWAVQEIGPGTYAIGEPRYYQQNYSYLILGEKRALLFDAGSGTRDMRPVVAALTNLPLTLVVSHLHYDHLGGAAFFGTLTLADFPQLRAEVSGEEFVPSRYEYLGMFDDLSAPRLRVAAWQSLGSTIDLGARNIEVIAAPGHTPTSIVLFDVVTHQLFSGDFLYPTTLYAFLPGASRSAYQETAQRLLARLPADTKIWSAHCCRAGEAPSAPWLSMNDLRDLSAALQKIQSSESHSKGFFPRTFPVNRQMTLATGFPWNNR